MLRADLLHEAPALTGAAQLRPYPRRSAGLIEAGCGRLTCIYGSVVRECIRASMPRLGRLYPENLVTSAPTKIPRGRGFHVVRWSSGACRAGVACRCAAPPHRGRSCRFVARRATVGLHIATIGTSLDPLSQRATDPAAAALGCAAQAR
jgi:hypothetical protein